MIYTSATQVAAVTPYEISGDVDEVTVSYQGQTSAPAVAFIVPSSPALFGSFSTTGLQAAALNQDGTINSASAPAKIGDVIVLYATGEGQTTPPGVDGKLASTPLPKPILPVSVSIGGQDAQVLYAGGAPGEVAGVMQVNVQIPAGIQTGNSVPVVLTVGSAVSEFLTVLAIR
jgi:uncharacterized protein (TIGR03437 family)